VRAIAASLPEVKEAGAEVDVFEDEQAVDLADDTEDEEIAA